MKIGTWCCLLMVSLLCILLLACGGKDPAQQVYADMERILEAVYADIGRPALSYASMREVHDAAFERMQAKRTDWPAGTSFATSVLEDHIMLYVKVGDTTAEGNWKP